MGKKKSPDSQVRLTPEFIRRCDEHGWPAQATFAYFFRKTLGLTASVEHQWRPLRQGEPVDRAVAEGFAEYARRKWGPEWSGATLASISRPARSDADSRWFDWHSIVRTVTERYRAGRQHYFSDPPNDARSVARLAAEYVGRLVAADGDSLDPDACASRGEADLRRSTDDYAAWIYAMWRHDYRTVMYVIRRAAAGRRKQPDPIGVTILLPLSDDAFRRLSAGEISDKDLTEADLVPASKRLFLQMMSDTGAGRGLSARDIEEAQIHNIMYQIAYFSRGERPARPTVLTLAPTPALHERLRRHGHHDVGVQLRGTDKPLVWLRPPEEFEGSGWKDHVAYDMFLLAIKPYKLSNAAEWKQEDRLKG
jgi:hypothetical protein